MRKAFSILALLYLLSITTDKTYAAPLISEVHPNPQEGPEWIELFNPEEIDIDLSGWKLYDQISTPSLIFSFESITLEAGEYAVYELNSMKLNNTADGIILKDAGNIQIDAMQYENTSPGKSWSRESVSTTIFVLSDPTPGSKNAMPQPSPSSSPASSPSPDSHDEGHIQVQIREIYPCPLENESESVTLKNTGSQDIILDNWKVRDSQNNLRSIQGELEVGADKEFSWVQPMLNNSGDEVFIETELGETAASAAFGACTKGEPVLSAYEQAKSETNTDESVSTSAAQKITSSTISAAEKVSDSYPLPAFFEHSPLIQENSSSARAIYVKSPTQLPSRKNLLSVILGGFLINLSSIILLYERKIRQVLISMG